MIGVALPIDQSMAYVPFYSIGHCFAGNQES
jgi:hypothetical protein